jgi:dTDP-4-dehydrorhamnose reductase
MLGHKVVQRLQSRAHDVSWTLRSGTDDPSLASVPELRSAHAIAGFDASRVEAVASLLREQRPEVVVNCLGVIKQRPEASELSKSLIINAFLPHFIAMAMQPWGGRLIHVSTDCVFSGSRGRYVETDAPDATDVYGQTKAVGEVHVGNAVTLRTSIIGRELKHHDSLLDWFLAQRGKKIRGFRRTIWSGVTTLHLADVIESIMMGHPTLSGVYHVSSGSITKYDLLRLLQSAYGLAVTIDPSDAEVNDRTLVGARFENAAGYRCPPLATLIADLVADPTPYPSLS